MSAEADKPDQPYIALVLDAASRAVLIARYATLPALRADHCTVVHGTTDPADLPPAFSAGDLGRAFRLVVTGTALRPARGIEAVVVALRRGDGPPLHAGFSANRVPHVTVATDARTPSRESNTVLAEGYDPVSDGPELVARLQVVLPETGSPA